MIRRLSVFQRKPSPAVKQPPLPSDAPTRDLPHFLELQKVNYKRALEHRQAKQWTVVMGNEAGDLDSVASAIAFAWFASTHLNQLAIPFVQTPREDFSLRAENVYALDNAGVRPEILLTSDDLTVATGESFALVDHNRIAARFAHVSNPTPTSRESSSQQPPSPAPTESKVTAIVDHHEDERAHLDAKPRVVEQAGSCSSLVTRLLKAIPGLSLPPELAFLLLSAIVIDTHGLKEGGKAIAVDHEAATWLLPRSGLESGGNVQAKDKDSTARALRSLDEILQHKKTAIEHLSTRDLLRRDYKEYVLTPSWDTSHTIRAGLATVPRSLKTWLAELRPHSSGDTASISETGFWDACSEYMHAQKLDVLGVLTTWRDDSRISGRGKHRREQAWLARTELGDKGLRQLWAGLESASTLHLKRKDGKRYICSVRGFEGRAFEQGDASMTRKATAPLLREIVEGSKAK